MIDLNLEISSFIIYINPLIKFRYNLNLWFCHMTLNLYLILVLIIIKKFIGFETQVTPKFLEKAQYRNYLKKNHPK